MSERPSLTTERLLLRPFSLRDAPAVQRLAGAVEVAAFTLNIPHPYEDGVAEAWIGSHQERFERGDALDFAVTLRSDGLLVGAIGLGIDRENERGELGYWIGVPYWGHGYCTEATRAVVSYAFEVLGLHRIHAFHFSGNTASGRVMQKVGMKREGCLRHHVKKWGVYQDLVCYGLTREEYEGRGPELLLSP